MQQLVTAAWVRARLGYEDLCILDCSITHVTRADGRPAYESGREVWRDGHVPGSRHIDLVHDLSDESSDLPLMMPPLVQLRDALQKAGVADGRRVVLYDNNLSMWAARVWWMLRAVSVDAVVLDGGWRTWTQAGFPVETGRSAAVSTAPLTLRERPGAFVTKEEVLDQLGLESTCLIDALHPKVYRGERDDYQRAGHIAGAQNVSAIHLVDRDTHQYLPLRDLRQLFAGTSIGSAERVITYCGAGIAGSSAAFALGLLGVRDVAVYDGSLSEWSADPALPMSTENG